MQQHRFKSLPVSMIFLAALALTNCGSGGGSDVLATRWPDVNGDGYADLAVVESVYNDGYGRIHMYFGGKDGVKEPPSQTITPPDDGSYQLSLTAMEDFNTDGYADLAISDTSRVYIYNGSASGLSSVPHTTISVLNNSLCAGDFNNDGNMDLAIGNTGHNSNTGQVLFHYSSGAEGLNLAAGTTLTGSHTGDNFGTSLSAGDMNGDGYADLAVSARGATSSTGQVTIFYGSDTGISITAGTTLNGEASGNRFGATITAGDINNDGYTDLVVAAVYYNTTSSTPPYCGRIYVHHGNSAGIANDAVANHTITGTTQGDTIGMALSTGDTNGDGYADIVYSANIDGTGGYVMGDHRGAAYIHNGSATGLSITPSWTKTGENESVGGDSDYFGAITYLSDLNGDGYADLYVLAQGCPWEIPDVDYIGRAYWFKGSASGMADTESWSLDAYFSAY